MTALDWHLTNAPIHLRRAARKFFRRGIQAISVPRRVQRTELVELVCFHKQNKLTK